MSSKNPFKSVQASWILIKRVYLLLEKSISLAPKDILFSHSWVYLFREVWI